jgi:cysteine desulfuration protein SufE
LTDTVEEEKSQEEKAAEILETFELFDNWEDRYQVLIDLGRKLPPMDNAEKTDYAKVPGCQSNVWLVAHTKRTNSGKVVEFSADSDAAITKGLVSILWHLFSGQPPEKIIDFDIDEYLEKLGLISHLSMNRRNGLAGMVIRIKGLAATALGS